MICYDVHLAFINRWASANGRIILIMNGLCFAALNWHCAKWILHPRDAHNQLRRYNDYSILNIYMPVDIAYFAADLSLITRI